MRRDVVTMGRDVEKRGGEINEKLRKKHKETLRE